MNAIAVTTSGAGTLAPSVTERRFHLAPAAVALLLAGAVCAAGWFAGAPLLALVWASLFAFLAVESDCRSRRIPNWLNAPALGLGLGLAAWLGGGSGVLAGLAGVATAFVLLLPLYAARGLGAGDVKAAMALGSVLGPAATLLLVVCALGLGAVLAVARLVARGEVRDFFARWHGALLRSIASGRPQGPASPSESTAAGGIPFALPLVLAFAGVWLLGAVQ